MTDWHPIPDDALLSLRRQAVNGERRQWAVAPSGDQVVVKHARFGDHSWSELSGRFSNLEDALKGVPELRAVRKGNINEYTLDDQEMGPVGFIQLLDLGPADGDENPDDWPAEVASQWEWIRRSMPRYNENMLLRWATIDGDGMWITGVQSRTFIPLAINENECGCPESLDTIAGCWWAFDNTGAPMSWAGGYTLERVAPNLACSHPYDDEMEVIEDSTYWFVDLPEESNKEFANVIAQWIIDNDAEVGAALSFEEFDPDDTLDEDELRVWREAKNGLSFGVEVCGYEALIRERLTELSSLYRHARDAIADPNGELGQRLLTAYGEGNLDLIRDGSWVSKD